MPHSSAKYECRWATIRVYMKLLRYIAAGFINFFSITQPSAEKEDRAAIFIAIMLLAVVAVVAGVVLFAAHVLLH